MGVEEQAEDLDDFYAKLSLSLAENLEPASIENNKKTEAATTEQNDDYYTALSL